MQSQNREIYKLVAIGKYELTGHLLGKGNYSSVREAIDRERQIRVALKIIDLENAPDKYIQRNYKREAVFLTRLKHPHIVKLFGIVETPNKFVMALEVMPENLIDYVRRHKNSKIEECMARVIFRQLASAVSFIHEQGVIHRDIKLENILYDRLLQCAKLTDFGLSNHWDKKTLLKTNCGSPEYSAPELHAGRSYDSAVDVWALGVVLFGMVVGRLPFDIARKKPVSTQHRREMFLEEMKCGTRSMKQQLLLDKTSYCFRELTSEMLNPDEHARIKMHMVEKHQWLMFKKIDHEVISNRLAQNTKSRLPSHRPITARTSRLVESIRPTTIMPKPLYSERPMTQISDFRPLRTSTMYSYREKYQQQRNNANRLDKS